MQDEVLKRYINEVLEAYLMEDFADSTRKVAPQPKGATPATGAAPQGQFNIAQLRTIPTLEQVLVYVAATLGNFKIGEGQGRAVFKLGNSQVLKVAKDTGGQGQNKAEATVCSADGSLDLFPQVSELGPQNMWLVTQEASGMTDDLFQKLTGLPWTQFTSGLKGAFEGKAMNVKDVDRQNFIEASKNQFFSKIVRVVKACAYEPGDLAKLDSWGVINGKPVIIDSGFTEAVNQTYYKGQGAPSARTTQA